MSSHSYVRLKRKGQDMLKPWAFLLKAIFMGDSHGVRLLVPLRKVAPVKKGAVSSNSSKIGNVQSM